jgi:hypothetical protein
MLGLGKNVTITQDNLPAVQKALKALTSNVLYVGVPDSTATRPPDSTIKGLRPTKLNAPKKGDDQDPITNAWIAYIQNNGSPANNIPARPFMTLGVKDAQAMINQRMKRLGQLALEGDTDILQGFHALGLAVVSSIKARMVAGPWQPLAVRTVMARIHARTAPAKGWVFLKHMTPLIDTGRLLNSITYVVRSK